jgi:hypothetical protein
MISRISLAPNEDELATRQVGALSERRRSPAVLASSLRRLLGWTGGCLSIRQLARSDDDIDATGCLDNDALGRLLVAQESSRHFLRVPIRDDCRRVCKLDNNSSRRRAARQCDEIRRPEKPPRWRRDRPRLRDQPGCLRAHSAAPRRCVSIMVRQPGRRCPSPVSPADESTSSRGARLHRAQRTTSSGSSCAGSPSPLCPSPVAAARRRIDRSWPLRTAGGGRASIAPH